MKLVTINPSVIHRVFPAKPLRKIPISRAIWDPKSLDLEGKLPLEYGEKDLKEIPDITPPAPGTSPLPSSKPQIKRILKKHGLRCGALLGLDSEEEAKVELEGSSTIPSDFAKMWTGRAPLDEENTRWLEEEISEEEADFLEAVEFGDQCMRELELEEITERAVNIHLDQRKRGRNLYASTMWYAKKLQEAESQDYHEVADPNPIPPYVRAMFTLEEEFEELNEKQYDVEVKLGETAEEIEEAEFREFLSRTVINMPTKPGDPYHDIFSPVEENPIEPEPEIEIDHYLYGVLPNVEADIGPEIKPERSLDYHLNELIFNEEEDID